MAKVELGAEGMRIVVYRDGQRAGHVWWNAATEKYHAKTVGGSPIGEHPLRAAAITMVTDSGDAISKEISMSDTPIEITDEIAQQVADAIGEHFRGDRDYWPRVMDDDWDGGSGRVIVWSEGLLDWAFLVSEGGESEYSPIEVGPMSLPAGVWVEPVNPQALRVLPNPRWPAKS